MNTQGITTVHRFPKLTILLTICLMLCSLTAAGPAKAQSLESFKTPTGNIICIMTNTDVECGIKSGLNPAPPRQACTDGDPVFNRVDLSATGAAEPLRCAGDPGAFAEEPNAKVLGYGTTMIKGETGCSSFEFGVVCANSKGHGFFLSRAVVRYF
jgi:uncharacterized protein DUF6636